MIKKLIFVFFCLILTIGSLDCQTTQAAQAAPAEEATAEIARHGICPQVYDYNCYRFYPVKQCSKYRPCPYNKVCCPTRCGGSKCYRVY